MPDFFKFRDAVAGYKKFLADPYKPFRESKDEDLDHATLRKLLKEGSGKPKTDPEEEERKKKAAEEGRKNAFQNLRRK